MGEDTNVRIEVDGQLIHSNGSEDEVTVSFGINENKIGEVAYNTFINELIENGHSGFFDWEFLEKDMQKAWVKVGKLSVTVKEI